MSRFTDDLDLVSQTSTKGLVTGPLDAPTRRTWNEISAIAKSMSRGLAKAGVVHGDSVAILAGEPSDIAPLIRAVWMRGASFTVLHPPTPRNSFDSWLIDSLAVTSMICARVVVFASPFEKAASAMSERGSTVVSIDDLSDGVPVDQIETFDDDVAVLQLTSGSTGDPKAIAITHGNLTANYIGMAAASEYDPDTDVMVSWLPLFHDMGMIGFLIGPMQSGTEAVWVTPTDFLKSPLLWPALITKYKGTMTAAPNFAYGVLARSLDAASVDDIDLSSLRFVLSGAEPIDIETVEHLLEAGARFGLNPSAMIAGYGMTEATLAVAFGDPNNPMSIDAISQESIEAEQRAIPTNVGPVHRFVTLGPAVPGIELRIVDAERRAVESRQVGEIEIRGAAVTRKYLNRSGTHSIVDSGGWLQTGDLGYLTEKSEVVVSGRKKELIIVAGRNLAPMDIERAAANADDVDPGNAIAVRIATPGRREDFAVLVESRLYGEDDACRRIKRAVTTSVFASMGVGPRSVVVLPPGGLPRTATGKLKRSEAEIMISNQSSEPERAVTVAGQQAMS